MIRLVYLALQTLVWIQCLYFIPARGAPALIPAAAVSAAAYIIHYVFGRIRPPD